MGKKLSGNPRIAYEQGKAEGFQTGGAQAIVCAKDFAVVAIYNIVQNYIKSEKKQQELVLAFCEEQDRLYVNEFWGNPDQVLLASQGAKRIYREIGYTGVNSGDDKRN